MFSLIGVALGFAAMFGLLALMDRIAAARGLGSAHPLSPAVAYSLLVGAILMLAFFFAGSVIDYRLGIPTAFDHAASQALRSTP